MLPTNLPRLISGCKSSVVACARKAELRLSKAPLIARRRDDAALPVHDEGVAAGGHARAALGALHARSASGRRVRPPVGHVKRPRAPHRHAEAWEAGAGGQGRVGAVAVAVVVSLSASRVGLLQQRGVALARAASAGCRGPAQWAARGVHAVVTPSSRGAVSSARDERLRQAGWWLGPKRNGAAHQVRARAFARQGRAAGRLTAVCLLLLLPRRGALDAGQLATVGRAMAGGPAAVACTRGGCCLGGGRAADGRRQAAAAVAGRWCGARTLGEERDKGARALRAAAGVWRVTRIGEDALAVRAAQPCVRVKVRQPDAARCSSAVLMMCGGID